MKHSRFVTQLAATICLPFFLVAPVSSQEIMQAGFNEFTTVDGEGRECRVKDWVVSCNLADWLPDVLGVNPWVAFIPVPGLDTPLEGFPYWAVRTRADSQTKLVGAAFSTLGWLNVGGYAQLSVPHYATSWLYKDITIDDPSQQGNLVEVQISPTYTWEGGLLGVANYEGRFSLSIEVEDSSGIAIGSFDLVSRDRSGDITIGLELPSEGTSAYDRNNDTNHFPIMLKRGETYRLYFKAEAHGAPLISGVESSVRARLESVGVSVPVDSTEQLAIHDTDIKSQIAIHDADLKSQLATHDADVKARLGEIQSSINENQRLLNITMARQLEILRLLITPEGQRKINMNVLTCSGDDCPIVVDLQCRKGDLEWPCK